MRHGGRHEPAHDPLGGLDFIEGYRGPRGELEKIACPLCVGVSRKSFIGAIIGRPGTEKRLAGSLAATAVAVWNGAALIRTHDVPETIDAVRIAERLRRASAAL